MAIQIKFEKQDTSMGSVKGLLVIDGKTLFYKFNDSSVAQQMMSKMQAGGAIITNGRKHIRVNIFGNNDEVKLGNETFNPKEKSEEEVEIILTEFFQIQYARAGFGLQTKKIK